MRIVRVFLLLTLFSAPVLAAVDTPRDADLAGSIRILEAWIESQLSYEQIPSLSVAIVHDGETLYQRSFGYANREAGVGATPDTRYSICSISKLFTSISALQLRDQGRLELDEPISTYLPWFDIGNSYDDTPPVTLRMLLSHSSGLPREAGFPYWSEPGFEFPSRDQIRKRVSGQEMLYRPERYFQYSNLALTLVGEVVAAVAGQSFDSYVNANILQPLGMSRTTTELPAELHGSEFAVGYGRRLPGGRSALPYYPVNGISPAAGFASTSTDLATFAKWQLSLLADGGNRVLSSHTLREMQRVHWINPDWDGAARGLGFGISRHDDKTFVGHGGACPGYLSSFVIRPQEKLGLVVMQNGLGPQPTLVTWAAYDLLSKHLKPDKKPAAEGVDDTLRQYEGKYRRVWGDSYVASMSDHLLLVGLPSSNPAKGATRLNKVGEHTFRRVLDDGGLGETYRFEVDSDGRALRYWVHNNRVNRVESW